MVYIQLPDGTQKKYACRKCIKGHRSSKCTHHDRELFEIKRKGRPITQCETCRLLRKTQQVHAKCECRIKKKESIKQESIYTTNNNNNKNVVLDEKIRYYEFSLNVNKSENTLCFQCDRPRLYCICHNSSSNSSICSEGSSSPIVITSPAPASVVSEGRHSIIPIHDPSDDIDSDTPIYKPLLEEDTTSRLGEFTNKSSEELMNQIYSGFNNSCCSSTIASPFVKEEEVDTFIELSRE